MRILKTPTGATSSLIRHLNTHPAELSQFEKVKSNKSKLDFVHRGEPSSKQTKLQECFKKNTKLPKDHARAIRITESIAKMMAVDYQPYTIVEDKGFRELCSVMEPNYELPCATTFSRNIIPNLYEKHFKQLKNEIQGDFAKGLGSLSFTTDMWTSVAVESYISFTCHYFDEQFKLKNHALATQHFPGSHSAENILKVLTDLLATWDLRSLSVPIYVVTDNAKNYTCAISNSSFQHVSCFAHMLQLVVGDAKKELGTSTLLVNARGIVSHFNHSTSS